MADITCPQCGAQFTRDEEGEAEGAYCPGCGAYCADGSDVPAVGDVEVIEVQAEPVGPKVDPGFGRARVRTFHYRGNGVEGQGCCCLGCLAVAFLAFLLLRGLLSLLGVV